MQAPPPRTKLSSFAQTPPDALPVGRDGVHLPSGTITDFYSDTAGGLRMSAGRLAIGAFRAGLGTATDFAIIQTGGTMTIGAANIYTHWASSRPIITLSSTAVATAASISGRVLTVGGTISGTWDNGHVITGAGVTAGTAIGSLDITGNTILASTMLSNTTTTGLQAGMHIIGPNVVWGTTIASITNSTTLVLSKPARGTAAGQKFTITGSGAGGSGTYIVNNSQTVSSTTLSGTTKASGANGVDSYGPIGMQIGALTALLYDHDNYVFYTDGVGNHTFNLSNIFIQRSANTAYSLPSILINNGYGSISNITATPLGTGTGTLVSIGSNGHAQLSGVIANGWSASPQATLLRSPNSAPTLSSCGTSPAVMSGSNNNSGRFTTGTASPSACTITFATANPTSSFCTISSANAAANGTTAYVSAQSASSFTVTLGARNDAAYNYVCIWN
jgi:hypothetical protein